LRHIANELHALRAEVKAPGQQGRHCNRKDRPRLGDDVRQPRVHAGADEQRFETLAHPEQEGR
jgi:hypothetical protein